MVHALQEIRRVLTANGSLIDLRPVAGQWPVEVLSIRARQEVGRVEDLPQGLSDDVAANEAMRWGETSGLFQRDLEETFPFYYTWDSPNEMQEYIEEEWADFARLEEDVWRRVRSAWATATADARVGIRAQMLITRWVTRPGAGVIRRNQSSRSRNPRSRVDGLQGGFAGHGS